MMLRFKLFFYKFFSTHFGEIFLKLISFGLKVRYIGNEKKSKEFPFNIIITTDTEAGYVDGNERRIWQKEEPNAFMGYYYGIRNLMKIFDKYKIKTTFFLSTQCFSSKGKEYKQINKELNNVILKGHEIGLHLHPDSDFSIQHKLSIKFNATSAFFYTYTEKLKIIKAAIELIEENLGKAAAKILISFRWGNWALDTDGVKALQKLGFKIDSSAAPGIKGHTKDKMRYDWSKVKRHHPWKLSLEDYQAVNHNNSNIIEFPIATFDIFGFKLRADPVNSILLNEAFLKYYKKSDRSKKPFYFVIITHSCEATHYDGRPTQALKDLDKFIELALKYSDVEFNTMREAYKSLKPIYDNY